MNVVLAGISEHVQYTVTKFSKIKVPHTGFIIPVYKLTMLRVSAEKKSRGRKNIARQLQRRNANSSYNSFSDSKP